MKNIIVQYGQSIWDIAINFYGDLSKVWDVVDDNDLVDGIDTDLNGGQILKIRTGSEMISNNISEYFIKYPATVNNSDYDNTGLITLLQIVLVSIANENHGGDGNIIIDIEGGKPTYSFVWTNQDTNQVVSTSQNLVAATAGTYSVTVVDSNNIEKTLNNLVISVTDNNNYLIDDFGNYVIDENGNLIIVN